MNQPLVTVCIATYNRASSLPNAIQTVQKQTYKNIELIIVDDYSADHTSSVVKSFLTSDSRISYIKHDINKGLAAARNTAIHHAKGKYFTFVDDDDEWAPTFVEEFVKLAAHYDENWCFCCGTRREGRLGKIENKHAHFDGKLLDYCKQGYCPPVASQFYFLSTLKKCGGYNEHVKTGVDHDLWLSLAFAGVNIKSLDKYLAYPNAAKDKRRKRMTNQYAKRIKGLEHSLSVWKKNIADVLGIGFYDRFAEAYMVREKKEFLKNYIMDLRWAEAIRLYREVEGFVPKKELMKLIFIAVLYNIGIRIRKEVTSVRSPELAIL